MTPTVRRDESLDFFVKKILFMPIRYTSEVREKLGLL